MGREIGGRFKTEGIYVTPFGDENYYINPGSVSLPKEGNPKTYMIYENRRFTIKTFDGETVLEKQF